MQSNVESERRAFLKVATASLSCALENVFRVLHSRTAERQMLAAKCIGRCRTRGAIACKGNCARRAAAATQLNHSSTLPRDRSTSRTRRGKRAF
jgi:hypothetical protein